MQDRKKKTEIIHAVAFSYRELCCEADMCPTLCGVVSGHRFGDGDTVKLRSAERENRETNIEADSRSSET